MESPLVHPAALDNRDDLSVDFCTGQNMECIAFSSRFVNIPSQCRPHAAPRASRSRSESHGHSGGLHTFRLSLQTGPSFLGQGPGQHRSRLRLEDQSSCSRRREEHRPTSPLCDRSVTCAYPRGTQPTSVSYSQPGLVRSRLCLRSEAKGPAEPAHHDIFGSTVA
jgi:hypothetical protein